MKKYNLYHACTTYPECPVCKGRKYKIYSGPDDAFIFVLC